MKISRYVVAALAVGSLALAGTAYAGSNSGPSAKSPIGTTLGSANLWAVINADGTVARSDGANVPATGHLVGFTGSYQIIFYRNVTGCAYTATIGNAGAGNPLHGTIIVALRAGNNNGVFVDTRDLTGALADRPFHVVVNC
jgi:hypothetical protein